MTHPPVPPDDPVQPAQDEWGEEAIADLLRCYRAEPPVPGSPPVIPGFDSLKRLAAGGMGTVYRARDIALDRVVCLKVIVEALANDPAYRARFVEERKRAAGVSSPHVVPVYQAGGDGEETPLYLVMEYIEGRSIAERVPDGLPISPREAAQWVEQIALGLAAVHAQGIAHLDVKPGNVLVDRNNIAKLTDFGLARAATETYGRCGTPGYMSPERAMGRSVEATLSDIYSLGAVLHRLLTGRPLYLRSPTDRPDWPRDVPADLRLICEKSTHWHPEQRYQTADEVARDLRRYLEHRPTSVRPRSRLVRTGLWCRRNPVVAALLSVVLVVVAVGAGVTLHERGKREEADRLRVAEQTTFDETTRKLHADARTLRAFDNLRSLGAVFREKRVAIGQARALGDEEFRQNLLRDQRTVIEQMRALQGVDDRIRNLYLTTAEVQLANAEGRHPEVIAALTDRYLEETATHSPDLGAAAWYELGRASLLLDPPNLDRALTCFQRAKELTPGDSTIAFAIANAQFRRQNYRDAARSFSDFLDNIENAGLVFGREMRLSATLVRGVCYWAGTKELARAHTDFDHILGDLARRPGPGFTGFRDALREAALRGRAFTADRTNRTQREQAFRDFQELITACEIRFKNGDKTAALEIAELLRFQSLVCDPKSTDPVVLCDRALEYLDLPGVPDDPFARAVVLQVRGDHSTLHRRFDRAAADFREAIRLLTQLPVTVAVEKELVVTHDMLAKVLMSQGRYDDAIRHWSAAVAISERLLSVDRATHLPNWRSARHNRALVSLRRGKERLAKADVTNATMHFVAAVEDTTAIIKELSQEVEAGKTECAIPLFDAWYWWSEANRELGNWKALRQDCERAIQVFERRVPKTLVTESVKKKLAALHLTLSEALGEEDARRHADAIIKHSEVGLDLLPKQDWEFRDLARLGRAYDERRNWDAALRWWKRAKDKAKPGDEKALAEKSIEALEMKKNP